MRRVFFTLLIALTMAACAAPVRDTPQTQSDVDSFALGFLDSIQAQSIAEQREFCGFILRDSTGRLQATPPKRGTFASCNMPVPRQGSGVIASYHTHGAYGADYDNEVPSPTDLASDFQLGMDGYISTPGGRVWRVRYASQDATQICGLGCVTRDPGFVPYFESSVLPVYTIATLNQRGGV